MLSQKINELFYFSVELIDSLFVAKTLMFVSIQKLILSKKCDASPALPFALCLCTDPAFDPVSQRSGKCVWEVDSNFVHEVWMNSEHGSDSWSQGSWM